MADQEKTKSNIIRSNKRIPDEMRGDYDKWLADRKMHVDGTGLGAAAEALIANQKISSIQTAAIEKAWVAQQKEKLADKSDRIKKANPVMVTDASEDYLKKTGLGKYKKEGDNKDEGKEGKDKDSDFLTKLFTAAIPLLAIGGGLLGSINQMFKGGPLQGIANIVSKVFVVLGDALVKKLPSFGKIFGKGGFIRQIMTKIFGKGLTRTMLKAGSKGMIGGLFKGVGKAFLKRLPLIGSLISIGSAVTRIKNKDFLGGLIDLGAAVAYMFPGIGTGIGIALDLLNASSDAYGEKKGIKGKGASIKAMFGDAFSFITDKLASFLEQGIKWVVDQLYDMDFIPSWMVGKALDFMGLPSYKQPEEVSQIKKNKSLIEKQKKLAKGGGQSAKNALNIISKLEQENQDLELQGGMISRDKYLLRELEEMNQTDDRKMRVKQREHLESKGFSWDEINETYKGLLEATKEQNKLMKESQSNGGTTTVASQNNTVNSSPTFVHTSKGIEKQRKSVSGRRHTGK